MKGVPVTISKNKYGLPVTPVAAGKAGLATVVKKGGMPILLTNNGVPMVLQFEYLDWLFYDGQEGHWSDLQVAMIGLDFSDLLGPYPGHWSDTQEAI